MAETQHLVDYLVSAATAIDDEGAVVLYTDGGNLLSKHLVSGIYTDEEIIADEARKDSPASYLRGPSTALIFYISPASELRVLRYNKDDGEWVDLETAPSEQLHREGNLAACLYPDGDKEGMCVFFQAPSGELVCLDGAWARTILPAQPLIGTPLFASLMNDTVHVFYVSKEDRCVHLMRKEGEGWVDVVAAKCAVDKTLKSIMIGVNEEGELEVYALTLERELLRISSGDGGAVSAFGKVEAGGKYVANAATECAWTPCWVQPCWVPPCGRQTMMPYGQRVVVQQVTTYRVQQLRYGIC